MTPAPFYERRRRTDQLSMQLAEAYRAIGVLLAVSVLRPLLERGDVAGALTMCDALTKEYTG